MKKLLIAWSKRLQVALTALFLVFSYQSAVALTSNDVMGDYILSEFDLTYTGVGVFTESDFSSYSGRLSLSSIAGTVELQGVFNGDSVWQWASGFYTISGNVATFRLAGEPSQSIRFEVPNSSTLIATGSAYDPFGDFYRFRYVFTRTGSYYTQTQVDQAVLVATTGLYTQTQLDQAVDDATKVLFTQEDVDRAVETALAEAKPKVVLLPLFD